MGRDIDPHFGHDLDGERIQFLRGDAGRVGFEVIAELISRQAFRHLAAAGVARAEKKDFDFIVRHFQASGLRLEIYILP